MEVVSLPTATAASLHPQIFRGWLPAVVNDVEVNLDAFNQAAEARILNSLDMYKYVDAAIVRGNEAKTSRLVEPLHGPAGHVRSPIFKPEQTARLILWPDKAQLKSTPPHTLTRIANALMRMQRVVAC